MPSKRKRIGYLPSQNIQEIITKIAKKEKLSQSRVVGILVEEALIARGVIDSKNINDLIRNDLNINKINIPTSYFKQNDFEELISDQGITYNTRKYKDNIDYNSSKQKESLNEDLFE
tara:strand:- start:275 stop:625 length:351 start_codon:yes stop_codon:yes gene_type:complete